MARTRTQQKATGAKAATGAGERSLSAANRRSVPMKRTTSRTDRVRFDSEVSVQDNSTQALNDTDTITVATKSTADRRAGPDRHSAPRKHDKKRNNIRTIADLPVSPTAAVSPTITPAKRTGSRRNVRTVSDYYKTTRPGRTGKATATATPSQKIASQGRDKSLLAVDGPEHAYETPQQAIPSGPTEPQSSLLRPGSFLPTGRTTKRPRASSSAYHEPPQKRPHISYDAVNDLDSKLVNRPRPLEPVEVGALFTEFKDQLRHFAFHRFRHSIQAPEDWPLHELAGRYTPLMQTTMFIADGSQYGWRSFFTNPESRASLVYGIIGEYIRQHVFAVPAFGLAEADAKAIEDIDFLFLHYDAFTRVKHRSRLLHRALRDHNWKASRNIAVETLVEHLFEVLTPLMPPAIFRHDPVSHTFAVQTDALATQLQADLKSDLRALIMKACGLNWSLVLTGRNGSVVSLAPHVPKGEKWYGDFAAPHHCINPEMMYQTQAHGFTQSTETRTAVDVLRFPNGVADTHGDDDKPWRPRIKMTCFPRVEMCVPHGADQQRLAQLQDRHRRAGGDPSTLPAMTPEGEEVWPLVPDEVKDCYERSKGPWPAEAGAMRMAYIDLYQHLTPHDVYLEHNYVPETEKEFVRRYFLEHSERVEPPIHRAERRRAVADKASIDNDPYYSDSDSDSDADADADSDSDASVVYSSSTSHSGSTSTKAARRYLAGHSDESARRAYGIQQDDLRRHLERISTKLNSTHTTPLPISQRVSLEQAVAQARARHASRSIPSRLGLSAHDTLLAIWNNLIAPHGTRIENYAFLLAVTAVVCWSRRGHLDLTAWLTTNTRALANATDLTVQDVKERLQRTWEETFGSSSSLSSSSLFSNEHRAERLEGLWAKASAKLSELLPSRLWHSHMTQSMVASASASASVTAARTTLTATKMTATTAPAMNIFARQEDAVTVTVRGVSTAA